MDSAPNPENETAALYAETHKAAKTLISPLRLTNSPGQAKIRQETEKGFGTLKASPRKVCRPNAGPFYFVFNKVRIAD